MAADTAELLRRIPRGDQSAFDTLYRAYQKRIFRYLLRLVGECAVAEELTHDVLVAVWQGAVSFQARSSPCTWIFGIARHKAMNRLRRRSLPRTRISAAARLADRGAGTDAGLLRRDLQAKIQQALEALSPAHRDVIRLAFYEGFSYQEIATIVGCPVNTVKTRMFHAKKQLSEVLARIGLADLVT